MDTYDFGKKVSRFKNDIFKHYRQRTLRSLFESQLELGMDIKATDDLIVWLMPMFPEAEFRLYKGHFTIESREMTSYIPGGTQIAASIPVLTEKTHRLNKEAMMKFIGLIISYLSDPSSFFKVKKDVTSTPDKETAMTEPRSGYDPMSAPLVQLPELSAPIRKLDFSKMDAADLRYHIARCELKGAQASVAAWRSGDMNITQLRRQFAVYSFRYACVREGMDALLPPATTKTIVKDGWRKEVDVPAEQTEAVKKMDAAFEKARARFAECLREAGVDCEEQSKPTTSIADVATVVEDNPSETEGEEPRRMVL